MPENTKVLSLRAQASKEYLNSKLQVVEIAVDDALKNPFLPSNAKGALCGLLDLQRELVARIIGLENKLYGD